MCSKLAQRPLEDGPGKNWKNMISGSSRKIIIPLHDKQASGDVAFKSYLNLNCNQNFSCRQTEVFIFNFDFNF